MLKEIVDIFIIDTLQILSRHVLAYGCCQGVVSAMGWKNVGVEFGKH
jgi:hypothetical protein